MAQSGSEVFREEVQEHTASQSLEMEHSSPGCWRGWAQVALFVPTDPLCEDIPEHRTQKKLVLSFSKEGLEVASPI